MPWRKAVLLLAIVAVFSAALGGDYVYDDLQLVVRNAPLQNGDLAALLGKPLWGAEHGYWRPLTSLSLWLGHSLGGAAGVHALALALHGGNALLAFGLARQLLGDEGRALAVALLFAVHPVQVEAVAWCSAINDPLWAMLVLLAVRAGLHWRDAGSRGTPWAAGAFGLLALLAKENALAALPLVVAGARWIPAPAAAAAEAGPRWRSLWFTLGAAALVWWLLRALVFGSVAAGLWREPDGAPVAVLRLLTAPCELLVRHWALLLAPWPGTPFRALPDDAHTLQATLAVALVAGLLAGLWRARQGLGTAPKFALLLLALPLLPTLLGWRSVGSYPIGERYLYLAVFGASLWLVHAVGTGRLRWLPWLLAAGAAPVSFAQTWHWRDQATLVAHGLAISPQDPNLRVMSGDVHLPTDPVRASADYAAAERLVGAAAERPHRALAAARLGLAWSLFQQQQGQRGPGTGQLVAAFQRAVDTDPERPAAWVGLGAAFGVAGRSGDAENAFRRALALDPDHPEAWFNLGYLQARTGRNGDARASLRQALRCNPQNGDARALLLRLR